MYDYIIIDETTKHISGVKTVKIQVPNTSTEIFLQGAEKSWIGTMKYVDGIIIPIPKRILTKFEFNSLFTFEELVAIETMARTDPAVAVLSNKFSIADEINLDEDSVVGGVGYLVTFGLLTEARAAEILGA